MRDAPACVSRTVRWVRPVAGLEQRVGQCFFRRVRVAIPGEIGEVAQLGRARHGAARHRATRAQTRIYAAMDGNAGRTARGRRSCANAHLLGKSLVHAYGLPMRADPGAGA